MKSKILTVMGLIIIALVASFHVTMSVKNNYSFDMSLEKTESLAVCEVSSNWANNTGKCYSLLGGGGDSCVSVSVGIGPVCSGNI